MPHANKTRRRRAHDFGLWAEAFACLMLMIKGYRLLARNYRIHGGEIDIIARRGRVIAFVEVKARPHLDAAAASITPAKVQRITRAARVWLGRNSWASGSTLRVDAIYVAPFSWPRHLTSAYELSI